MIDLIERERRAMTCAFLHALKAKLSAENHLRDTVTHGIKCIHALNDLENEYELLKRQLAAAHEEIGDLKNLGEADGACL